MSESSFGEGLSGTFLDARAGAIFEAAVRCGADPLSFTRRQLRLSPKEEEVLRTLLSMSEREVLDVRNSTIQDSVSASVRTVAGAIAKLIKMGLLVRVGHGRRRWMAVNRPEAEKLLASLESASTVKRVAAQAARD